jgi:hypothetical protein
VEAIDRLDPPAVDADPLTFEEPFVDAIAPAPELVVFEVAATSAPTSRSSVLPHPCTTETTVIAAIGTRMSLFRPAAFIARTSRYPLGRAPSQG